MDRKQRIVTLLKGLETGRSSVEVIHPDRHIQHNSQTHELLSATNPRVNVVRISEDGDYVFGHTEYDFSTRCIGFEVFRFEGDHAVEHWDNIQPREGLNEAGRSMVDGTTAAADLERTEANRDRVREFVQRVIVEGDRAGAAAFVDPASYVEHSPRTAAGLPALQPGADIRYERIHRVLAQGNFVLCVSEGFREGVHSSFYDLFRVDRHGKLVEHWDTVEAVPPPEEWKNDNGKF